MTRVGGRPPFLRLAAATAAGGALLAFESWRSAALLLCGIAGGWALLMAGFGFAGAWRRIVVERRAGGVRAQALLLALVTLLCLPLIAEAEALSLAVEGHFAPLGLAVVFGAALFGVGMQLAGGCGSGTLFVLGGGQIRMLLTLGGFVAGALWGSHDLPAWLALPSLPPLDLAAALTLPGAITAQLALCALLAGAATLAERRRHGGIEPQPSWTWRRGPWPLAVSAAALALVAVAILLLSGRPWTVTEAFALWGAKLALAGGWDVSAWPYWESGAAARALAEPVWRNAASLTDAGIILGAALAAGWAGRPPPSLHVPLRAAAAALIGGLMMGYGARLAFGCNIGALISGAASGSGAAWLWLACAFAGSRAGVALRVRLGL